MLPGRQYTPTKLRHIFLLQCFENPFPKRLSKPIWRGSSLPKCNSDFQDRSLSSFHASKEQEGQMTEPATSPPKNLSDEKRRVTTNVADHLWPVQQDSSFEVHSTSRRHFRIVKNLLFVFEKYCLLRSSECKFQKVVLTTYTYSLMPGYLHTWWLLLKSHTHSPFKTSSRMFFLAVPPTCWKQLAFSTPWAKKNSVPLLKGPYRAGLWTTS